MFFLVLIKTVQFILIALYVPSVLPNTSSLANESHHFCVEEYLQVRSGGSNLKELYSASQCLRVSTGGLNHRLSISFITRQPEANKTAMYGGVAVKGLHSSFTALVNS